MIKKLSVWRVESETAVNNHHHPPPLNEWPTSAGRGGVTVLEAVGLGDDHPEVAEGHVAGDVDGADIRLVVAFDRHPRSLCAWRRWLVVLVLVLLFDRTRSEPDGGDGGGDDDQVVSVCPYEARDKGGKTGASFMPFLEVLEGEPIAPGGLALARLPQGKIVVIAALSAYRFCTPPPPLSE